MAQKIVIRTGEKTPVSGQYRPAGARTEVTLFSGRILDVFRTVDWGKIKEDFNLLPVACIKTGY